MNRECERFIDLLTDSKIATSDEAFLAAHSSSCRSCNELLHNHNKLIKQLAVQAQIPEDSKNRIFSKIRKEIIQLKAAEQQSPLSVLNTWLNIFRPVLAVATVLLVAGAILLLVAPTTQPATTVSGNGLMLVSQQRTVIDRTVIPLQLNEKVGLLEGTICLSRQNQEMMTIKGALEFSLGERAINIHNGSATIDFRPSAVGYRVTTPVLLMNITGTTICVEITEGRENIAVEKGKISWSLRDGSRSGSLEAGQGIQILSGSAGLEIKEFKENSETAAQPANNTETHERGEEKPVSGQIREPLSFPDSEGQ